MMKKLVVSEFLTFDGIMEAPHEWSFPYWSDEISKFKHAELFASDALLLGRVTYEGFAAAWPSMTDDMGYADRMNTFPKYVVTSTLSSLDWNGSQAIKGDVAAEVSKLKKGTGGNILVFGSADLVHTLREHDLVDEYQMMVYPIVRAQGKHLFQPGIDQSSLKLAGTKTFDTGVIVLTYVPDRSAA
jgi:dihydrofolate reductase